MSSRMMANENLLYHMRKCDTSDETAAELLNSNYVGIQVQPVSQLGSAPTTSIRLFKINSCPKTNIVYYFLVTMKQSPASFSI